MEFAFYFAAGVAVLATLRVITNSNPVHALLYLIISLLAISMTFFSLGHPSPAPWRSSSTLAPSWFCSSSW